MELDAYVAAVLAGEAGGISGDAALRAMAVAARTYAVRFAGRHKTEGFDFCDTTHCQDYRGVAVTDRLHGAAESTEGEMVWFRGSAAATYYSHDCGGRTEAAGAVWPDQAAAYLIAQDDPWCSRAEWTATVPRENVRSAEVLARTSTGRVARVRVDGRVMGGPDLRFTIGRTLGWNLVRSDWWSAREAGARIVFEGRGHGHGVGLCQDGAAKMAAAGKSYREILTFYYPGTQVGVGARGFAWKVEAGERVELWTAGRQDRRWVAMADGAARVVERSAGFGFTRKLRTRVFPDVATFRDATGEPGWIVASTRGGVVRTHPAGMTAESLRHEFAHVLVESRSAPRTPLWMREGAARWIAGERTSARAARPADAEFTNPRSRESMRAAYDQALAEVAALVAKHGAGAIGGWLARGL